MIGGRSALLAAGGGNPYGNWTGNYLDVSLLLRGYGGGLGIADESSTPKTITVFGNAGISTATFKYGGSSLVFDGAGDWLNTVASASPQSGDYTVEMFIRPTLTTGADQVIYDCRSTSNPNGTGFALFINTTGKLQVYGDATLRIASTATVAANTWQHIALVSSSGTVTYYIGGTAAGSFSATTTAALNTRIGARQDGAAAFTGFIDEFRLTLGVARYISNFTPPAAELPANATDDPSYNSVSLLLRNGLPSILVPLDESPTPKALMLTGSVGFSTTVFKYGGTALVAGDSPSFSWGTSRLEIAPSLAFAYGTGDYTVEAWIYPTGLGNNTFNQGSIMLAQLMSGINYFICAYRPGSTSSFVRFAHAWATSGEGVTAYSPDLPRNQWSHVAVVRSNGQVKVYGNGVSGSPVSNTQDFTNTTYPVYVGTGGATENQFEGYIDDLRVTKGVARYTKNFLPPPAELPAI